MYKNAIYTVLSNEPLTGSVWRMILGGDTQWITAPGQFVNIALEGRYLRRPISVCDYDERTITLIYKVVGDGTAQMSRMAPGVRIDLLTGLGNGFSTDADTRPPAAGGRRRGRAPALQPGAAAACRGARGAGGAGFQHRRGGLLRRRVPRPGVRRHRRHGRRIGGRRGFRHDGHRRARLDFDYFYACGPLPMLRALCQAVEQPGELSFEERMGCGFGACMGCSCRTLTGGKRICKEGPVLKKEEIIW